jgi:hypothetical protein
MEGRDERDKCRGRAINWLRMPDLRTQLTQVAETKSRTKLYM